MSETGFVPSSLTVEEVRSEFNKALRQMEHLHLRGLINKLADTRFRIDEGWLVEEGEDAMSDMRAFRDRVIREMQGG